MSKALIIHPSYTYADGDIILRSSDDVHFRVHSFMLKLASGFFRQMFDIPRSASESPDDAIPLTEDSPVIACLLDLVYPTADGTSDGDARLPALNSLDFAWLVSTAADKYDIPRALASVRAIVLNSDVFHAQPLGLYALACRWKWAEVAHVASCATLRLPLLRQENFHILRTIESKGLCNLLELHAARKNAILGCFDLRYRDHKNFIVYQWECGCSTEEDGTKTESFSRLWDAMRCVVIASLEESPLGLELREAAFWSKKDLKLWNFTCLNCGKQILNKAYFIKRIGEVLQSTELPMHTTV